METLRKYINFFWIAMLACDLFTMEILFNDSFFIPLKGKSTVFSHRVLIIMVLLCLSAGIVLADFLKNIFMAEFGLAMFPFCLYGTVTYYQFFRGSGAMLKTGLVLSAVFSCLILFREIKLVPWRWKVIRRRIFIAIFGSAVIMEIFSSLFIVPAFSILSGGSAVHSGTEPVPERSISVEDLQSLNKLKGGTGDLKERAAALQRIANMESGHQGLPEGITIRVTEGEGPKTDYDDKKREIDIRLDYLSEAGSEELTETVCYYAYLSYRYRVAEACEAAAPEYRDLLLFRESFGTDDAVRRSARRYAEERVNCYSTLIRDSL